MLSVCLTVRARGLQHGHRRLLLSRQTTLVLLGAAICVFTAEHPLYCHVLRCLFFSMFVPVHHSFGHLTMRLFVVHHNDTGRPPQ